MNTYLFPLVNGVGIGIIYFLLAVGLSLIFGLLRFVNFAHGAFYMVAAYITYAVTSISSSLLLALLIAPISVAILALAIDRSLLRFTYQLPHEAQILITFAVALIIQEVIIFIWGPLGYNVPVPQALSGVVVLGDFVYPIYRVAIIGISAVIGIGTWIIVERTNMGAVLRAGAESAEMVSLLGFDINRLYAATFALGGWLAGIAGVMAAPLRGVEPFMAHEALAVAFIVVVVGGLGTFAGALAGSLLVGIVQSVMASVWPEGAHLMIYGVMATVLLLRPNGLFGRV